MKKKYIFSIVFVIIILLFTTSCSLTSNYLESSTIYTTVEPINFLVKYLYSDYAESISSIYPSDCNINEYEIPEKKMKEIANGDLFIYNGLTDEKNIAKNLVNINHKLLIIDASYRLTLENDPIELWLSPNNYLMLAKNIKDKLIENLNSKKIIEGIENKFNSFEVEISTLDASLHEIGQNAKQNGKNTIIASNNGFKYLENYGFNVISLKDTEYLTNNKLINLKNNFKNGKYTNLLVADTDINDELVLDLINNYKVNKIDVNTLTLSTNKDYFSILTDYIQNIKKACA